MIDPTSRLREGISPRRYVEVTTKAGILLLVGPCLITPREVLTGRLTVYQASVMELRNAWARSEISNSKMEVDGLLWAQVAIGALQACYDVTRDQINDWLTADDMDAIAQIGAAACGRTTPFLADQRRRALSVAALGMADVALSSNEIAMLSDFAMNAGLAPRVL